MKGDLGSYRCLVVSTISKLQQQNKKKKESRNYILLTKDELGK